jgi:hypothetical protein
MQSFGNSFENSNIQSSEGGKDLKKIDGLELNNLLMTEKKFTHADEVEYDEA